MGLWRLVETCRDAIKTFRIMRKLIHILMEVIFTMKFVKYEGDLAKAKNTLSLKAI